MRNILKLLPQILLATAVNFFFYIAWLLSAWNGSDVPCGYLFAVSILLSLYILFFIRKGLRYKFVVQLLVGLLLVVVYMLMDSFLG